MPFEKGHNKQGGRIKGTKDVLVKEARQLFVDILERQVPNIEQALNEVYNKDKAKYLELYAKYAQYFVPKKVENTLKDERIEVIVPGEGK